MKGRHQLILRQNHTKSDKYVIQFFLLQLPKLDFKRLNPLVWTNIFGASQTSKHVAKTAQCPHIQNLNQITKVL